MSTKFFDDWYYRGKSPDPKPQETFVENYGPGTYAKCSDTHPPLKIGEYTVYGGACANPLKSNGHYDIEIGLDFRGSDKFPWDNVIAIHFPINDREAPKEKDAARFKKMIVWTAAQIRAGKKVHVGCMGGHGRTSLVLVALVATLAPDVEDAIAYVREHYCHKAVETAVQVKFLMKHYKVKSAASGKAAVAAMAPVTVYDRTTRGEPTEMEAWLKRFPQPGMEPWTGDTYEKWKAEEEQKKGKGKKKTDVQLTAQAVVEVRPVIHKATVLGNAADTLGIMADPSASWNQK